MDYMLVIFVLAAFLALLSSLLIFVFRNVLHAVLALTMLFMFNSLLFLLLHQPLLAVIQLFIMVGGVATFLFVGVASAELMEFRFTRLLGLAMLWVIVFLVLAYPIFSRSISAPASTSASVLETGNNIFGTNDIISSLNNYSALYYTMLVLLFSVSIGAIIALKKLGGGR